MTQLVGCGLVFIKKEGGALHPDDPMCGASGMSDEIYEKQLRAYAECDPRFPGVYCSRPEILQKIIGGEQ